MRKQYILNFTPTGMIPMKADTPHVPTAPSEIVEQVAAAVNAGANMVHLHARDQSGAPTYCKEVYAEIVAGIRHTNPDVPICVSTSGRNWPEFEKRSACLDLTDKLKPDFASLTLGSLNFAQSASVNSPEMILALARKMLDCGIRPELEVFDLGIINYAHYLIKKRAILPPYYFNIILANIATAQADLLSLGVMIQQLPSDSYWSVGGIGAAQLRMNTVSLAMGGGVRVGLEDNIYYDEDRTRLATNLELVERVAIIAEKVGRRPFTCREARSVLGLD